MRAPELAMGAWVFHSSVMAKMPSSRKAVRMIWSSRACIGVIASPGWVKNTPAAPPSPARVRWLTRLKWSITGAYIR